MNPATAINLIDEVFPGIADDEAWASKLVLKSIFRGLNGKPARLAWLDGVDEAAVTDALLQFRRERGEARGDNKFVTKYPTPEQVVARLRQIDPNRRGSRRFDGGSIEMPPSSSRPLRASQMREVINAKHPDRDDLRKLVDRYEAGEVQASVVFAAVFKGSALATVPSKGKAPHPREIREALGGGE